MKNKILPLLIACQLPLAALAFTAVSPAYDPSSNVWLNPGPPYPATNLTGQIPLTSLPPGVSTNPATQANIAAQGAANTNDAAARVAAQGAASTNDAAARVAAQGAASTNDAAARVAAALAIVASTIIPGTNPIFYGSIELGSNVISQIDTNHSLIAARYGGAWYTFQSISANTWTNVGLPALPTFIISSNGASWAFSSNGVPLGSSAQLETNHWNNIASADVSSLFTAWGGTNQHAGFVDDGPVISASITAQINQKVYDATNVLANLPYGHALTSGIATNAYFNSFRFMGLGDSLTTTNPSANISYPSYLASFFGWNVVTNDALGGTGVGAILARLLTDAQYFPCTTRKRTLQGLCVGKNNQYGMVLSDSNVVAYSILFDTTNILLINSYAGFETVLITLPYTVGTAYAPFANSEPARLIVNNTLLSMTNFPGVVAVIDFDSIAPPNTWTNSNGTVNTAVTLDGLHPTNTVNLALATAINTAIFHSSFNTSSTSIRTPNTRYIPQTNASGMWISPSSDGQEISRLNIGDNTSHIEIENNYNPANAMGDYGMTIKVPRDLSNGTMWALNVMNAAKNRAMKFNQSDDEIYIGSTVANPANGPTWTPPATGLKLAGGTLMVSNLYLLGRITMTNCGTIIVSNSWANELFLATNGAPNFCTIKNLSSNGFPTDIYYSNGVAFPYYQAQAGGGILP